MPLRVKHGSPLKKLAPPTSFAQARSRFERQQQRSSEDAARPLLGANSPGNDAASVAVAPLDSDAGKGPLLAGTKLWEQRSRAPPGGISSSPLLVGPPASHSLHWAAVHGGSSPPGGTVHSQGAHSTTNACILASTRQITHVLPWLPLSACSIVDVISATMHAPFACWHVSTLTAAYPCPLRPPAQWRAAPAAPRPQHG